MTLQELTARYGNVWTIAKAVGDGWYAIRRAFVSAYGRKCGLSDVRCGMTLAELARNLEAETQRENRLPLRLVS